MPETLTDAQKVLRNDTGKRIAVALEALASEVEPSTVIAPEYDATQTYTVGDLVMYRGVLYRCTTAITTPEEWTAAHWTATSVSDEYRSAAAQDVIDAGKETAGLGLTGASVGDLVRVAAVDTNGKPTSWQKAPLCDIVTNPNLLDNWYFVGGGSQQGDGIFPINQQGQASYSDINTIDRWNVSAANRVNVELLTDAMRLTKSSNTAFRFRQYANSYDGQVTLSVLVKSASYSAGAINLTAYTASAVIEQETIPSSNEKQLISMTFNAADLNQVSVTMTSSVPAGSYVDVIAMKLELGTEQTLAHQEGGVWVLNEIPDYGDELLKCQRYFQTFRTEALRPTYGADCRPLMTADEPTKGTITINGVTYYTLTA